MTQLPEMLSATLPSPLTELLADQGGMALGLGLDVKCFLTPDGAVGGPGRDGVAPLVEEDVGAARPQLLIGHQVHTAVIIAVPLAVH